MAWSFEGADRWSRFQELFSRVWHSQDLGSNEYRELSAMCGSDWAANVPATDCANPRRMLAHAQTAFFRAEGWDYNSGQPA